MSAQVTENNYDLYMYGRYGTPESRIKIFESVFPRKKFCWKWLMAAGVEFMILSCRGETIVATLEEFAANSRDDSYNS